MPFVDFYGVSRRDDAIETVSGTVTTKPSLPRLGAVAGVAALLSLAALGFTLWLDQGEALFVRLAADAWASCF
ncbi:hypothetical protein [Jiella avicenniae]|uniref:Uncharacterized protein n=1 Tax=Jiella avicenniae TaxID=2907202 RepID=A0A9X1P513_9HYPH|nr:hypothetical protein [Jiella avicenniae]MCE7029929.1 hypothetical protein [Jiella avicenniae]